METTLPEGGRGLGQIRAGRRLAATGYLTGLLSGLLNAQRGALMPWSAVVFGLGTACYFALTWEPSLTLVAATGGVACFLLALCLLPALASARLLGLAAALLLGGFANAAWRAHTVAAPVLEYRSYGPVTGRVVRIDRSASDKPRLMLDQVHMTRQAPHKTPARVRISLHGDLQPLTFRPGDHVMATAHLSPPPGPAEPGGFDFQRHAWFERLGAVGYTRVPVLRYAPPDQRSWALALGRLRTDLATFIRRAVGGDEGPFAAAILTGDRTAIPMDALNALRASNLAHLLAISGLHMGLLTGVVFALVRYGLAAIPAVALRLSTKKVAAVAALIVGLMYLGLSGANVATQRAFIMVAVMLIAICLDRRALTLRAVALAAFIVLLIRPESLYGPGFQMSFAATTALVAGFRIWRDTGLGTYVPRPLRGIFGVAMSSLIAGLATAPFAAAHFNMFAQYGLVANLLSVPVMGLVVMPGAVLAAILVPVGLEGAGFWIMGQGLAWILWVALWVAGLDGSVSRIVTPQPWILPCVVAGGLVLCLWQGWWRLAGAVPVLVAIGFWSMATRPVIILSDTGSLVGVMMPKGRALNKAKGDGFAARIWLENDGDSATQEMAHARAGLSRNEVVATFGGQSILFDRRKTWTALELQEVCKRHAFVMAVKAEGPLPCAGIGLTDLRAQGAVALTLGPDGSLQMDTANGRRGRRLWVPKLRNQSRQ